MEGIEGTEAAATVMNGFIGSVGGTGSRTRTVIV